MNNCALPRFRHFAGIAGLGILVSAPSLAQQGSLREQRLGLLPGQSNWVPQAPALPGGATPIGGPSGIVTSDMSTQTAADLVTALLGPGVSVSNVTLVSTTESAGTFTGGTGIIGFEEGVILSSGNIASVAGPENVSSSTTSVLGLAGDTDLTTAAGVPTNDATILEFDFECAESSQVSFQFVFSSEEYNEFVFAGFNDPFLLILNGANIALTPGGTPVTIDNVNCGNPFAPPAGGSNCGVYINNDCSDLPGGTYPCTNIETEMDGLTTVFSAVGTLQPGVNHLKLAIADAGDSSWDSNVFLRGSSLICGTPTPAFEPPTPCGQTLQAIEGVPLNFDVVAIPTNGQPAQCVSIDAAGSPAAITGNFTPSLPTACGNPASTAYSWTPGPADVGNHQITLTATDQIGTTVDCVIDVVVQADCNGNGVGDDDELAAGGGDWNCNGVLDDCEGIGTRYCSPQNDNTTGGPAYIVVVGSDMIGDNDVTLTACGAPEGVPGYFLTSKTMDMIDLPAANLSSGFLCLGTGKGRFLTQQMNTGPGGTFSAIVDLNAVPQSTGAPYVYAVQPGMTVYFQGWFRDTFASPANNFTDAVWVMFQ